MNEFPRLLNITQTAKLLGVSRNTVYLALKKGELPTKEIAGKKWILRDPLLRELGSEPPELKQAQ